MSTRSTVGYWTDTDEQGNPTNFIGTYVHHDGNNVGEFLRRRFGDDVTALKLWVDEGIQQAGYSSAEQGAPNEGNSFPITLHNKGVVSVYWLVNLHTGNIRKLSRKQIQETLKLETIQA